MLNFFFFKNKNSLSEIRIITLRKKKESNKEWSNIIGEHACWRSSVVGALLCHWQQLANHKASKVESLYITI